MEPAHCPWGWGHPDRCSLAMPGVKLVFLLGTLPAGSHTATSHTSGARGARDTTSSAPPPAGPLRPPSPCPDSSGGICAVPTPRCPICGSQHRLPRFCAPAWGCSRWLPGQGVAAQGSWVVGSGSLGHKSWSWGTSGCSTAPGPTGCPSAPLCAVGVPQPCLQAGSARRRSAEPSAFASQRPHPHTHPHDRGAAPGPAPGHPGHPTGRHSRVSAQSLGAAGVGGPAWSAPSPSGQMLWPLHMQA